MPLYEFVCDRCSKIEEEIRDVEDRNNEKNCSICDSIMRKTINAPSAIIFPFKMNAICSSGRKVPGKFYS